LSPRKVPPRAAVPAWLARARTAAEQPPLSPRDPLLLGTRGPAIGSVELELGAAMVAAGLPIAHRRGGWTVVGPADPSLAAIADWLLDRPLGLRRRGELLPVVDEAGRTLAAIERGVVRVLGLRTFAVHLSGRAADGRAWVQQRAFDKATDPGRWDTLMGGQMAAGESIVTTLERETAEEAGLALSQLDGLTRGPDVMIRRPVTEGWMDERIAVFRATLAQGATPSNRDGEVVRFACLEQALLRQRLAAGDFTLEATLILGAEIELGASDRG
jgi:isopentenyldiphosphate isomerase